MISRNFIHDDALMIFQSQILFHPVSFSEIFRSEFLLKSENLQRNFPNIYSNYKHKNVKYLIKQNLLYFTAKIYFVKKVNLYSRVKKSNSVTVYSLCSLFYPESSKSLRTIQNVQFKMCLETARQLWLPLLIVVASIHRRSSGSLLHSSATFYEPT